MAITTAATAVSNNDVSVCCAPAGHPGDLRQAASQAAAMIMKTRQAHDLGPRKKAPPGNAEGLFPWDLIND